MATKRLKALSNSAIKEKLPELHGWTLARGALRCEFKFETFKKALDFVSLVGALAEEANHHPDIDIRYCTVKLSLSTHDVGGISEKDFALAAAIDRRAVASRSV